MRRSYAIVIYFAARFSYLPLENRYQLLFTAGLLILTECLYRYTNIPGFDQPFTDQHNFGNYVDLLLMNKINHDCWVAINCIPTAAHTIWGAVAGKWLLSLPDNRSKLSRIFICATVALVLGYGLDFSGITPIIKRKRKVQLLQFYDLHRIFKCGQ